MLVHFLKKISCLALLLILCANAFAGAQEGKKLRTFLHDIIVDTGVDQTLQADVLRKIFATHADLLPLLLEQSEFEKLLADADLSGALQKVTGGEKIRTILEDSIESQVLLWMKNIEKADAVPTELMREHIHIAKRFLRRLEANPNAIQAMEKTRKGAINFTKEFAQIAESERYQVLKMIPDVAFTTFAAKFNKTIESSNFSKLGVLDAVLGEKNGIQIPGLSPEEVANLNKAFKEYFDHLEVQDKRKIIGAWMKLPPGSSMETQLAEVIQNSGPVLQKIFQLFGRDSQSPEVRAIMKELLSNVKPFDTKIAKVIVEQSLGKSITALFLHFDEAPIAAGTIGQVYKAKLQDGRSVVVKVLRPGIKNQMEREFHTLLQLVKGNKSGEEILLRLKDNFMEELDFRKEAKNQIQSLVYRDKKLGLNIPKIIEEIPLMENILISELAPGKSLSSLDKLSPEIHGQVVYNALKKWFDEVIFGGGFFHGDMHPGNMLLQEKPDQKPPFLLTIIDPGSAGHLSLEERRNMVRYFFALSSKNTLNTVEAIRRFGKIPEKNEAAFIAEIDKIWVKNLSIENTSNEIMKTALLLEIEVNPTLLMFQRAQMFLVKELEKVNEELLAKNPKAKIFSPNNAYFSVGLKRAGISIPKQFFSQKARGEAVVETELLRKFFVEQLKDKYQHVKLVCKQWFSHLK